MVWCGVVGVEAILHVVWCGVVGVEAILHVVWCGVVGVEAKLHVVWGGVGVTAGLTLVMLERHMMRRKNSRKKGASKSRKMAASFIRSAISLQQEGRVGRCEQTQQHCRQHSFNSAHSTHLHCFALQSKDDLSRCSGAAALHTATYSGCVYTYAYACVCV